MLAHLDGNSLLRVLQNLQFLQVRRDQVVVVEQPRKAVIVHTSLVHQYPSVSLGLEIQTGDPAVEQQHAQVAGLHVLDLFISAGQIQRLLESSQQQANVALLKRGLQLNEGAKIHSFSMLAKQNLLALQTTQLLSRKLPDTSIVETIVCAAAAALSAELGEPSKDSSPIDAGTAKNTVTLLRNSHCLVEFGVGVAGFTDKDYLNNRYSKKMEMACQKLCANMRQQLQGYQLCFSLVCERIVLVLKAANHSCRIHLVPLFAFALGKLVPTRNNVRPPLEMLMEPSEWPATPHYNNTIAWDMHLVDNYAAISPFIADASAIAQVWLQRFEFFTPFMMEMIMTSLLNTKILSKKYTGLQMFKITLGHLSKMDFTTPMFLGQDLGLDWSGFHEAIIDFSGRTNLAAHMSKAHMNYVQY